MTGLVRLAKSSALTLNRLRSRQTIRLFGAAIGVISAIAVGAVIVWWISNGFLAGDTVNYWLAGQRINVGHELYAVRPDDPAVPGLDIRPFGLYSPPLIAVPWRVLALVPGNGGMAIWWVAMAFVAIWAIAAILLATRGWAGLLVLPLIPSIGLLIGVANVDAAVIARCDRGLDVLRNRKGACGRCAPRGVGIPEAHSGGLLALGDSHWTVARPAMGNCDECRSRDRCDAVHQP